MNRPAALAVTLFAAAFIGGLALRTAGDYGTTPWMISRASGLVAFGLLSLSVIFGLLISTKAADGLMSRPFVFAIHQFLSVIGLTFIGLHAGALMFDGFFHFGPLQLLVPFASPYRTFWVGLGVISAWLTAIVAASFWVRNRIGQKRWRTLHYASFAAYVLGLGHGIASGTDTSLAPVQLLYVGSAALVAALITYRLGTRSARPAAKPARPAAAAPHSSGRRPLAGPNS